MGLIKLLLQLSTYLHIRYVIIIMIISDLYIRYLLLLIAVVGLIYNFTKLGVTYDILLRFISYFNRFNYILCMRII